MSERSAKWLKKRSFLDQREEKVKSELSEASDSLEVGVKKVLVATAAIGATVMTGYMIYRAFSKSKRKNTTTTVETSPHQAAVATTKPEKRHSLKHAVLERLALALIQIISTQIAVVLSKKSDEKHHS